MRKVDLNCKPYCPQAAYLPTIITHKKSRKENQDEGGPHIQLPGMDRRTFLQAGTTAALGFILGSGLSKDLVIAAPPKYKDLYPKLKNIGIPNELIEIDPNNTVPTILVWCDGGASQLEGWDPKPDFPDGYRSYFGTTGTSAKGGVIYSDQIPHMAQEANKLLVLRGVFSDGPAQHFEQSLYTITGNDAFNSTDAPVNKSFLQKLATEVYRPNEELDIPVFNSSKGSKPYPFMIPQGTFYIRFTGDPNGFLSPFGTPADISELLLRLQLHKQLGTSPQGKKVDDYDNNFDAAIRTLVKKRGLTEAFELSKVDPLLRKEFGDTPNPLANAALTALLLIRSGAKFVVIHHGYFDHHYDYISETKYLFPPFDQAMAALIRFAAKEGFLLAIGSEFGRTPKINDGNPVKPEEGPGRDHWTHGYSVALAGKTTNGKIITGGAFGKTDKDGIACEERLHASGFFPTIFKKAGYELRRKDTGEPYQDWPIPV